MICYYDATPIFGETLPSFNYPLDSHDPRYDSNGWDETSVNNYAYLEIKYLTKFQIIQN